MPSRHLLPLDQGVLLQRRARRVFTGPEGHLRALCFVRDSGPLTTPFAC